MTSLIPQRVLDEKNRAGLWGLWRHLDLSGVEFDYEFDAGSHSDDYTRHTLLRVLATARPPATVFGETSVVVDKKREDLAWFVYTSSTPQTLLVKIPWRHAYDWCPLLESTNAGDLLSALTVSVAVCPLDSRDVDALEVAWPGVSAAEPYSRKWGRAWEPSEVAPDPPPPSVSPLFAPRKLLKRG